MTDKKGEKKQIVQSVKGKFLFYLEVGSLAFVDLYSSQNILHFKATKCYYLQATELC